MATEATGSDKTSEPWTKSWKEAPAPTPKQEEPVQAPQKASGGPWERSWAAPPQVAKRSPVAAPSKPVDVVPSEGWASVNAKYKAGQANRDQVQLDTLRAELSKESDKTNRERITREIGRVEQTIKKGA